MGSTDEADKPATAFDALIGVAVLCLPIGLVVGTDDVVGRVLVAIGALALLDVPLRFFRQRRVARRRSDAAEQG